MAMKAKSVNIPRSTIAFITVLLILFAIVTALRGDLPLPGGLFTTDSISSGVDLNIYASKDEVYLNGGPSHPGVASLLDGSYYVHVTNPAGSQLVTSIVPASDRPFVVSGDVVEGYYNRSEFLIKASGGSPEYDDTDNPGGKYKIWVSNEASFINNSTKTDNFKVKQEQQGQTATLCVHKFYDANANGVFDVGDQEINGWQFQLFAGDNLLFTRETMRCMTADPDTYHVVESDSLVSSWVHTGATNVVVTLAAGETQNVWFGNACLGPGGGLTLGFWSNKNGQNLETSADFTFLNTLNIVQANGSLQRFTGSLTNQKTKLNTWLLNASATNMANMLSAQLLAMELNVRHSYVSGDARVYVPNLLASNNTKFQRTPALNSLGFISINNLMSAANTILIAPGNYTVAAGTLRSYEEVLKTALDNANNNLNFVQPSPCSMSFAPLPP
jgi:hypothetical protein